MRTTRGFRVLLLVTLIWSDRSFGQSTASDTAAKKAPEKIEDNSFLIEEAYNQEAGVVQHISTFQRSRDKSWAYTFTQEWPVKSITHQLSYTVPVLRDVGAGAGVGDIALNYRYQARGAEDEAVWFSPRLSVYLPTGDAKQGRGSGGPGLEVTLPVSIALSDAFTAHLNASGVITRADDGVGTTAMVEGGRVGASIIWLVHPNFNFLLESTLGRSHFIADLGRVESENTFIVSPGVRGAINFASGLQIVPGLAFPVGVGPSRGQRDVFLYLSFEHPFR